MGKKFIFIEYDEPKRDAVEIQEDKSVEELIEQVCRQYRHYPKEFEVFDENDNLLFNSKQCRRRR